MRELNEKCVYSLEDLTSEEKKQLLDKLIELDNAWNGEASRLQLFSSKYLYFSNTYKPYGEWLVCREMYYTSKEIVNAKELFYTLENIQVDCRELTEEQIKEMADIFENAGYKVWNCKGALNVSDVNYLLEFTGSGVFVSIGSKEKTTITYEKFMELFAGTKQATFDEFYEKEKERINNLGSVQPHYDNTKGSIYKFCNDQKLNSWEFDIIKRVVRCRKKGQFREDLEKTKYLIDLYLKEFEDETIR